MTYGRTKKNLRWQKIRFHGQVAEIALFMSQPPARLPGAEIKKKYAVSFDKICGSLELLFDSIEKQLKHANAPFVTSLAPFPFVLLF